VGTVTTEGIEPMPSVQSRLGRDSESLSAPSPHEAAFEAAFVKHYARVLGLLFRLLGDRGQAEELASDVFLKLYRQPWLAAPDPATAGGDLPAQAGMNGWLYRTASNLGIDALRAAARRQRYEHAAARANTQAAESCDPLQEVIREEQRRRVRAVLAKLDPARAQILVLRATGLSYLELAEILGVKRGSVGTMLMRAEADFHKRFLKMFGREKPL